MSTKLMLIRHGASDWNLKRRYCGFADRPLAAKGKKQAKRFRKRIKCLKVDAVYSSDRKRALQTAGIAFAGAKIKKMPGLREMHFGIFEGMTFKEIMKKYPKIHKEWLNDPFSVTIPKGERLDALRKRVANAIKKIIRDNPNKTVAVVFHGGAISAYITAILKSKDFWKHIPGPTGVCTLEYKGGKFNIITLNDTSHLNG